MVKRVKQQYPFGLTDFFRLGRDLESVLQQKFDLVYYTSITLYDYAEEYIRNLNWIYGQLICQRKDEWKELEKRYARERSEKS